MEVDIIKQRIGIASSVTVYDYDIDLYVRDCIMDMRDSGVPEETLAREDPRVVTAVTYKPILIVIPAKSIQINFG